MVVKFLTSGGGGRWGGGRWGGGRMKGVVVASQDRHFTP